MMSAKFVALTLVGCSSPKVYLGFLSEVQIPSLEVASTKSSASARRWCDSFKVRFK